MVVEAPAISLVLTSSFEFPFEKIKNGFIQVSYSRLRYELSICIEIDEGSKKSRARCHFRNNHEFLKVTLFFSARLLEVPRDCHQTNHGR